MKIEGIVPQPIGISSGTLVLVFGKVIYGVDESIVKALQQDGVIASFKFVGRALNTKVLGMPWNPPRNAADVAAQIAALGKHKGILEAHGFAIPELQKFYLDTDHEPKAVPYIDGGELTLAMASANPDGIADAMPYLRAPQRHDWFIDRLFAIAEKTKSPKAAAHIWNAIAEMPIPPASNPHHKTFALALARGAEAFTAAGDAKNAKRLADRAATLAPKPKPSKKAAAKKK